MPAIFDEVTGKSIHLSGTENLARIIGTSPNVRWGFPLYRCTYDSNEDWAKFMEILNERMKENLAYEKSPELFDFLNWHVFEDRASFDGASKSAIRKHFCAWTDSDEAKAEIERSQASLPILFCCIHVDAEVIDAVVHKAPKPPDDDMGDIGYVNLIHVRWEPQPPVIKDAKDTDAKELAAELEQLEVDEDAVDALPEIEGTTDWDVGWMKAPLTMLIDCYTCFLGGYDLWQNIYERPPKLTAW